MYPRSVEMNWQIKTYIDQVFILDGWEVRLYRVIPSLTSHEEGNFVHRKVRPVKKNERWWGPYVAILLGLMNMDSPPLGQFGEASLGRSLCQILEASSL